MDENIIGAWNNYILRLAKKEDVDKYYKQNFCPLDKSVAYYTGCKESFTKEEVTTFFLNSIEDKNRYFFLIIAPNGDIIGESVINQIDWNKRNANFRICIFQSLNREKGIGSWVIELTLKYAFNILKLKRLELDVYSFNKRAQRVYQKAGFKVDEIIKDGVCINGEYADDIFMSILLDEWKKIHNK